MFKMSFSVLFILLRSCGSCPNHQSTGALFSIHLTLEDKSSFYLHGYHTVKNLEYDKTNSKGYLSNLLLLPLGLNQQHSTFVIYGDSISDTLRLSGYSVQAEITDDCGYYLKMKDQPYVSYHTFSKLKLTNDNHGYSYFVEVVP